MPRVQSHAETKWNKSHTICRARNKPFFPQICEYVLLWIQHLTELQKKSSRINEDFKKSEYKINKQKMYFYK